MTDQTFDTEVTEQAADVVGYTPDAPSKTMILDEYNKVLTFSYSANTYRYEIHYFLQEPDGSYMEKEVDTTPTGVFDTTVTITPDPNRYGAHYSYNSVKSVVSGVVTVDDPATILKLNVYYDLDFHTLTFDTMGGSAIDPVTGRSHLIPGGGEAAVLLLEDERYQFEAVTEKPAHDAAGTLHADLLRSTCDRHHQRLRRARVVPGTARRPRLRRDGL